MVESERQNKEKDMTHLDENLDAQAVQQERRGAQTSGADAEKLIAYLEAVRSGDSTEALSLTDLSQFEEASKALARTQVLHIQPEASPEAPAPITPVPKKSKKDTGSITNRNQRIKKMEGPANTAKELAEKLSYFTYYELLYLDDDATEEAIHAAYIKRTTDIRVRFRCGAFSQEWRLNEFIRALHEAHTVLTNPTLRKEYDEKLESGNCHTTFKELVATVPDLKKQGLHWSSSNSRDISLRELLLCARYISADDLDRFMPATKEEGQDEYELAQTLADNGLITYEQLASVLLGKALIDRRQISLDQFKNAMADMREHSNRFVETLINRGWLTLSELSMIKMD